MELDDDDDFLEALQNIENQNLKRKRSKSIIDDDIDAVFGSPSPLSRLKSHRREDKENLGEVHTQIWFPNLDLEEGGEREDSLDQDDDDVPLVRATFKGEDKPVVISDDDEDVINPDIEDADSRDSEVIGPSPQKQPKVFVRTPRLSLGDQGVVTAKKSPVEENPVKSEVDPISPKLEDLVSRAKEVRDKLFRSRSFHKHISKLIQSEARVLREDYESMKSLIVDMFPLIPFGKTSSLPDSVCQKLTLVQECQEKLRKRLEEFEIFETSQPSSVSPEENDRTKADDSPPFDGLPELDVPPPLSATPLSAPATTSTVSTNKHKFTFKRTSGGTSSSATFSSPATGNKEEMISTAWSKSSATAPASFGGSLSTVQSWTGSSGMSVRNYEERRPANSRGGGEGQEYLHTGTQLIEDFDSQKPETVNYTSMMYQETCDDINTEGRFLGEARNDGNDPDLCSEKHHFSSEVREVLSKTFGLRTFRPNQLPAINSILLNHDTFVLMPTGGGKSLCYQLPASVMGGVTVVVSPLVSLILDQVTKLNGLGISADHLSGEDYYRQQNIFSKMRSNQPGPTLLYVTPEKLSNSNNLTSVLTSLYNRKK